MSEIHVMSPKELESFPEGTVVWMETRDYKNDVPGYRRVQPLVLYNGVYANDYSYILPDELRAEDDIQLKVRCWNYRPTITTMENEPWIIREEWRK